MPLTNDLLDFGGDLLGNYLTRRTARRATNRLTAGVDNAGRRITDSTNLGVDAQGRALTEQRGLAGTRRGLLRDALGEQRGTATTRDDLLTRGLGRQEDLYNQRRGDLDPYASAGREGATALRDLVRENPMFDVSKVAEEPGYAFGLAEGEKGVSRLLSARGTLNSGQVKDLIRFANDYATTKVNDSFNRFTTGQNQRLDRINALTGTGLRAAEGQSQASGQFSNEIGATYADRANVQRDLAGQIGDAARGESDIEGQLGEQIGSAARAEAALRIGEGNSLARLEQDRAEAEGAGEIASGNANQGLLNTAVTTGGSLLKRVLGGAGAAAGAGAALPAGFLTAAGTLSQSGMATLTGLGEIASQAATMGVGGGITGGATSVSPELVAEAQAALGGTPGGSAIGAFLSNPWTIGVGAALAVGAMWLKSQAHWEANEMVEAFENPFHYKSLAPFAANWDQSVKSGKLDQQQGHALMDTYLQNFSDYIRKAQEWAGNSSDKKLVSSQSISNLWKTTVGPQIRRMQSEVRQLPQQVAA